MRLGGSHVGRHLEAQGHTNPAHRCAATGRHADERAPSLADDGPAPGEAKGSDPGPGDLQGDVRRRAFEVGDQKRDRTGHPRGTARIPLNEVSDDAVGNRDVEGRQALLERVGAALNDDAPIRLNIAQPSENETVARVRGTAGWILLGKDGHRQPLPIKERALARRLAHSKWQQVRLEVGGVVGLPTGSTAQVRPGRPLREKVSLPPGTSTLQLEATGDVGPGLLQVRLLDTTPEALERPPNRVSLQP